MLTNIGRIRIIVLRREFQTMGLHPSVKRFKPLPKDLEEYICEIDREIYICERRLYITIIKTIKKDSTKRGH